MRAGDAGAGGGGVSDDWDGARYEREKRRFIESRLQFRSVYFHTALIFTITWLAGWLCSWALLKVGAHNMPLRYGISFLFSYGVFVLCVRQWAGYMRAERGSGDLGGGSFDMPGADAEGCFFVFIALIAGLLVAALFAMSGGLPLLMEVAFEVVFAGIVVKRLSRKQTLGDWLGALVRNTWIHALVALIALVSVAAILQVKAPQAATFAAAIKTLKSPGSVAP